MARGVRDQRGRVESEADGGCGYSTLHCTGDDEGSRTRRGGKGDEKQDSFTNTPKKVRPKSGEMAMAGRWPAALRLRQQSQSDQLSAATLIRALDPCRPLRCARSQKGSTPG